MPAEKPGRYGEDPPWTPPSEAVAFERRDPPGRRSRPSRIVRHAAWPFVRPAGARPLEEETLRRIAHAYLVTLSAFLEKNGPPGGLGVPKSWIAALDPEADDAGSARMRWLPVWPALEPDPSGLTPVLAPPPGPRSWWLIRASDRKTETRDWQGTVILAAMETTEPVIEGATPPLVVNRDIGLRVPLSIAETDDGPLVRIRSMTAELPAAPHRSLTEILASEDPGIAAEARKFADDIAAFAKGLSGKDASFARETLPDLRDDLQLGTGRLAVDDLRAVIEGEKGEYQAIELRGRAAGALSSGGRPLAYGFDAEYVVDASKGRPGFRYVRGRKRALSTSAGAGEARVFRQDPASFRADRSGGQVEPPYDWRGRRASRTDKALDAFREEAAIGSGQTLTLEDPDVSVRRCPGFVPEDTGEGVKSVTLPADGSLPVRDNDFTALMAWCNAREFYRIADGLDVDLATFAVAAERVVHVFYRSGIEPGPGKDGETINARVSLVGDEGSGGGAICTGAEGGDDDAGADTAAPPRIEVHCALGDFWRRARDMQDPADQRWAQPLGIADAERWMWHEFGHVLIAARLGQLELDFAHSLGDALAAVKNDPFSRMADPRGGAEWSGGGGALPLSDRFRGYTFPWVFIPRRHDRNVTLGWAWGGSLNRSLLDAPEGERRDRKGYITEQILSSTAFRLYRILGGDTVRASGAPDFVARQRASAVTLFLLIEAMRTFTQPPSAAEALEAAMEDADTERLLPLALPESVPEDKADGSDPLLVPWTGGCALKAIRWAFEAQGMFAPDPARNNDAPGCPPEVDVYIADRRPLTEAAEYGGVLHGPGGYVPVSLDWDGERLWQGDPADMSLEADGLHLSIRVANRGRTDAGTVSLRAWAGVARGDPAADDWASGERLDWLPPVALPDVSGLASGAEKAALQVLSVQSLNLQGASALVLLVEATCPADRANSDPDAELPCGIGAGGTPTKVPAALADLAANDNNLGLWMLPLG